MRFIPLRSDVGTCTLVLLLLAACPVRGDMDLAAGADALIYGDRFPGGAGDLSGWDIAAGDLDGDGIQDLVISAPYADGPGDTRWSTMDMYIFFGRPEASWGSELPANTAADVIVYGGFNPGTGDSDFPGWDIACGDIDGDGFDELAFSAPHADGPAGDRNATGAIYIYYGRPRAQWPPVCDTMGEVGPAADIEIYGADENDSIGGRDLAGSLGANVTKCLELGDITGDGRAEVLFGAVYADGPDNNRNSCGDLYVVFGNTRDELTDLITVRPEDPGRDVDVSIYGGAEMDFFGFSAAVGDFDGDTVGDLAVGALYSDGPAGAPRNGCGDVWIFFGRGADLWSAAYDIQSGAFDRHLQGRAENGHAPYRLAAGDIDGDLRDDLVLATPHNRAPVRPKAGEWQIFFGREEAAWPVDVDLAAQADVWFQGRNNVDVWGTVGVERWEIGCDAALGDIDGDGRDDLLLGAKFGDSVGDSRPNAGEAMLILGREQAAFDPVYDLLTQPALIAENIWGAEAGVTGDVYHYDAAGHVVLLADLAGDGLADLVLAAPFADGPGNTVPEAGEVYILFRSDPAGLPDPVFAGGGHLALEVWPNPSQGEVTLRYALPRAGGGRLEVFDAEGRRVWMRAIAAGDRVRGTDGACFAGSLPWGTPAAEGPLASSGVYLVRLSDGGGRERVRRLVVTR